MTIHDILGAVPSVVHPDVMHSMHQYRTHLNTVSYRSHDE
jgi:phenylalanine-4-hydroxylase